ncbi:Aste57867_21110 [Aphanomyces stellatus]|uniref:Aste57867_21110 protein n=1 Tax=Aphanomyces stellatus TaxID=120398 RepID=A0A485LIS6_9STRA|nr:hypothetical protein As57867_021042 [Aphanomyces stellatus]VFT97784.1 Aste57867_21110 [Aphanomyces stellatus]
MRRSSRVQAVEAAKVQKEEKEASVPITPVKKRRGKRESTEPAPNDDEAPNGRGKKEASTTSTRKASVGGSPSTTTMATPTGKATPKKRFSLGANYDSDDDALLGQLEDALPVKRKPKKTKKTADPFDSLDALFAENNIEQEKKRARAEKLAQLRQENQDMKEQQCSLKQLSSEIETNMKDLQADDHLFSIEDQVEVEQFGYVFEPMTEPLKYMPFLPSEYERHGPFGLVFECMATTDDDELASLLWSQAIIVLAVEIKLEVPHAICHWLFSIVSSHSNAHVIRGAFMNLVSLLVAGRANVSHLTYGLPHATLCRGNTFPAAKYDWRVSFNDFLGSFRTYGFKESKRALNSKQKAHGHAVAGSGTRSIPFPSVNMEHVTTLFILSLRAHALRLSDYDLCTSCIFFLRMQFEEILRPQLCELSSYCLEVLLDAFPSKEWRVQYAPLLIKRIAGVKEGFFQSAAAWLTIARRLPRTERGTQLTTGLAIYVLQHRPDSREEQVATSEEPLKFPLQCDLVLDIVSTSVDSLIATYAPNDAREIVPPYDLICTKIALMDLALQAFLNYLQPSDMRLILEKLDSLALANKATVVVQWHEMKTLVSLMRRKYAAENLRIGRLSTSPKAKVVLFIDD